MPCVDMRVNAHVLSKRLPVGGRRVLVDLHRWWTRGHARAQGRVTHARDTVGGLGEGRGCGGVVVAAVCLAVVVVRHCGSVARGRERGAHPLKAPNPTAISARAARARRTPAADRLRARRAPPAPIAAGGAPSRTRTAVFEDVREDDGRTAGRLDGRMGARRTLPHHVTWKMGNSRAQLPP